MTREDYEPVVEIPKHRIEVHFSKYVNEKFQDHWKFETVEADTEQEAINKILESNKNKVNYILSCTPVK